MSGRLIEAEHFARYAWAAQFASGKRVLDAACGVGYGTTILGDAGAVETIGVDLDPEVIARADSEAPAGVSFRVGDLRDLPFGDSAFDLVVCFEAIEHVSEPGRVLDELGRVLGEKGVLIVSTPNRDVYTPGNPFHLRELTPNELEAELASRFRSHALHRQHSWIASAVFDDKDFEADQGAVVGDAQIRKVAREEPGKETYTVGIASEGDLPEVTGLVELTADIDIRTWSARLEAADSARAAASTGDGSTSEAELKLLRGELIELRRQLIKGESELARFADLEERLAYAHGALQEYDALKERFDELSDNHEGLEDAHRQVVHSSSWRLTAPLRRFAALLRSPS
jgi:O-antigen biosynthesis protein